MIEERREERNDYLHVLDDADYAISGGDAEISASIGEQEDSLDGPHVFR